MAKQFDDNLFEDVKFQEAPKFDDSLFEDAPVAEVPEVSMTEALGRGALQGASFGFSEEAGSAITAIPDFIREKVRASKEASGLSQVQSDLVNKLTQKYNSASERGDTARADKIRAMIEKETQQPFKPEESASLGDIYSERRDLARAKEEEVKEAAPVSYFAGEMLGGIAPAIATGGAGAVAKIGTTGLKTAIKEGAKSGAKYGAVSGLGTSEADLTEGDIEGVAKDVATGTAAGTILGGALPVVAKGVKAVAGKVPGKDKPLDFAYDKAPRLVKKIIKATELARKGDEVVGQSVENKQLANLEGLVDDTQKFLEASRKEANELIESALDPKIKINVSDKYGKYVGDLQESLKKFTPDSDEAKTIKNAIQTINKQREEILGSATFNPQLPTRKEAIETLQKKLETVRFQNEIGVPQAKAIDNLFNKVAKMKEGWEPDMITAKRVQTDFSLPDEATAVEMLKDVAKLKINKNFVDKESGMIRQMPVELVEVIKKYEPSIQEKAGRVYLQRGPGQVRESEILSYRPDMIEAPLEVNPQQLRSVEAELRELSKKADPGGAITKVASDVRSTLLNELPPELAEKFKQGMLTQSEINRIKDLTSRDIISKFQGAEKAEATQALSNLLEAEHGFGGAGPGGSRIIRDDIKETLKRLDPKFGQEFEQRAGEYAQKLDLNRVGETRGISPGIIAGGIESLGVRGGAVVGTALQKVDKMKALASIPKEKLATMAQDVAQQYPKLSNFLNNLASVQSQSKKNALLFVASQKPDLKAQLEELLGKEEE